MRLSLSIVLALSLVSACGKGNEPAKSADKSAGSSPAAPAASRAPAAFGGTLSNDKASAVALQCEQRAHDVPGNDATSWYMKCPAGCTTGDSVWGSDFYTDDSAICRAAIHAGAASADKGGTFLVTWAPGQRTYIGTEKNDVTTNDYARWSRSFFIQTIDADGKPTSDAPKPVSEDIVRLSCRMGLSDLGGEVGDSRRVSCPAGCTTGNLWGTDTYTGDSGVCAAAVHAGVVPVSGGEATITIGGPQKSFKGAVQNGVTSQDYGSYDSSFTVRK